MATYRPYSRRVLRHRIRAWLKAYLKLVVVSSLVTALVIVGEVVLLLGLRSPGPLEWFLLGAISASMIGALASLLCIAFLITDGTAVHQVRGAWGEENTRDELKRAKARGQIWGWIDSVTLANGDIDHIVVTRRGGLVIIDSKWRTKVDAAGRQAMVSDARASSRRAEGVIRTVLSHQRHGRRAEGSAIRLRTLVALWGSAQTNLPRGAEFEGVHFVRGRELRSWLTSADGDAIDQASAEDLLASLKTYRASAWAAQVDGKRS